MQIVSCQSNRKLADIQYRRRLCTQLELFISLYAFAYSLMLPKLHDVAFINEHRQNVINKENTQWVHRQIG